MMKIFNKILWGIKPPENKSDIWFDGDVFKIYRKGDWEAITIEIDAASKLADVIKNINDVYQTKLNAGDGIVLEDSKISTNKIFQVVGELPKTGDFNTIYLLTLNDTTLGSYAYVDNDWREITSTIFVDDTLSLSSNNPVKNSTLTAKFNSIAKELNDVVDYTNELVNNKFFIIENNLSAIEKELDNAFTSSDVASDSELEKMLEEVFASNYYYYGASGIGEFDLINE